TRLTGWLMQQGGSAESPPGPHQFCALGGQTGPVTKRQLREDFCCGTCGLRVACAPFGGSRLPLAITIKVISGGGYWRHGDVQDYARGKRADVRPVQSCL